MLCTASVSACRDDAPTRSVTDSIGCVRSMPVAAIHLAGKRMVRQPVASSSMVMLIALALVGTMDVVHRAVPGRLGPDSG